MSGGLTLTAALLRVSTASMMTSITRSQVAAMEEERAEDHPQPGEARGGPQEAAGAQVQKMEIRGHNHQQVAASSSLTSPRPPAPPAPPHLRAGGPKEAEEVEEAAGGQEPR